MPTLIQSAPVVATAVAGTSAVSIIPAAGTGQFRDLVSLVITTINAAAGTLTVSDGTKTTHVLDYPNAALAPSVPLVVPCDPPVRQTGANAAWTVTASVNASGYHVTAQYVER